MSQDIANEKFISLYKDLREELKNDDVQCELRIITDKYERQIDQMVYKLYGLTEEEIKIVEGFNKN